LSGEGAAAFSPPDKGGPGGVAPPFIILNRRTDQPATDAVALAYDERKRSRLKVILASGAEAGIFLGRGDHLRGGDRLAAEDGSAVVEIVAAAERLIEASAGTPLLFARAAYHLGNRHVPVQLIAERGGGRLRFQLDHVLAEMVRGVGCTVGETEAPFEPEPGAYGGGHRHHGDEPVDLHAPGHGPHRALPKIHEFKPR
jgi:urease accessory protein